MKRYANNIALVLAAPALAVLTIAVFTVFKTGLGYGVEAVSAQTIIGESSKAAGPHSVSGLAVPILMYHHVGDLPAQADPVRQDLTVSTKDFSAEIEWLAQHKYHTVTLAQVYEASQGRFQLPSKPIALTFDDGYGDVFANAVPVLLKNGFVGSFAIITQWPGTQNGTNSYATWAQILGAQKQGMEIVSHTQDHFDGGDRKFGYDFVKKDLLGSRQDLRNNLGMDTNILIYPYGHYTADYIRAAHDAGFVMGLTVSFGKRVDLLNLMTTPRIRVHGSESMEKFQELVLK